MTHGFDDQGASLPLMVILKIGGQKPMPINLN
jgi:hypothetical protein